MPASWLFWVPVLVALISVLVIVHESGHYLIARAFGMRVLRYSIGIGPVLFKYQPKDSPTVFQICAIPFLAYVQIDGMNPTDDIDPKDPALFANKGVIARILTILGGPVANYLFASLVIFFLVLIGGQQRPTDGPMIVGSIQDGSPAALGGIELGDEIVGANGVEVHDIDELIAATRDRAEQPTLYLVRRHDALLPALTITPQANAALGGRAVIGITPQQHYVYEPATVSLALQSAVIGPFNITIMQLELVAERLQQHSTEGMSGPVGMVRRMRESANEGAYAFVLTLAVISVALGFFNLLPFPALDGGRLVFLFFELITRRRANERVEAVIHMVGIVVLLCFAAYVTIYRDIPG